MYHMNLLYLIGATPFAQSPPNFTQIGIDGHDGQNQKKPHLGNIPET